MLSSLNTSLVTPATRLTSLFRFSRNEMMEITILRNTNDVERKVQTDVFPLDPMSQFTIVMRKYLNSVFVKTQDFK